MLAFLRELYAERLRHRDPLSGARPEVMWDAAVAKVEAENTIPDDLTCDMVIHRMIMDGCLNKIDLPDGRHVLQISDDGVQVMRSMEAALTLQRKDAHKERTDEKRWRVTVYFAIANLVSAAIGFWAAWLLKP